MYPLKMKPVFKDYLWGGNRLREIYKKDVPFEIGAESWEASCHPNGHSIISNGDFAGKTLESVIGSEEKFPLLFKLIDANDNLSVQVHPDDKFANANENGELGKTEMWYVLHADAGSKLVIGVKSGVTRESFKMALDKGELESQLNFVEVKKGDCFFIPAGLIHAIGKGIVIAEIQQNSDTTYRVYDYNRVGADGKPRPLHVDKALAVSDFSGGAEATAGTSEKIGDNVYTKYVSCEYFSFDKIEINGEYSEKSDRSFQILFMEEGKCTISGDDGEEFTFEKGDTYVIPASLAGYTIKGMGTVLKSYVG
ncbi:MAG: class I mannose-6-phosphate isomerase [Oscillospiraceae bacterium]|nr:class I mannose-6-phosphate isomerase [Oscillospiraceae bacterium]